MVLAWVISLAVLVALTWGRQAHRARSNSSRVTPVLRAGQALPSAHPPAPNKVVGLGRAGCNFGRAR
jgi:hypothetical protein